jgi:U3 small nucleolar RNA-associated protein 7
LGNEDGGDVEGEEGEDGEAEGKGGKKEKEKYKMRGKSGSMKKYLRKKKKNVIDPSLVSVPLRFGS